MDNTLSNKEIIEILFKKKIIINGVMMSDNLPRLFTGFYLCNLDQTGDAGTHWTVLYYDMKKSYYFDSMGCVPCTELERRIKPYVYNDQQYQNIDETSCGYYCIAFIMYMHFMGPCDDVYRNFKNMFLAYPNNSMNDIILKKIIN